MSQPRVVYHPPAAHVIEQFARAVSQLLSQEVDRAYGEPSVIRGFADFLKVIAAIEARRRSDPQRFDSDHAEG